jgi:hypothetical protein
MPQLIRTAVLCLAALLLGGCQKDFSAVALTSTGSLVQFTTRKPGTISSTVNVTLNSSVSGDNVIRFAAQPGTNTLYCITAKGYLCTLDATSGVATAKSTPFTQSLGSGNNSVILSSPVIAFDPVSGALRVIATGYNLLVNPTTGALELQATPIKFDSNDSNSSVDSPVLAGIAYKNPVAGASTTTLYALDITTSSLLRVGNQDVGSGDTSVNGGDLRTIGPLGAGLSANTGFAIAPSDGTAYASLQNGSSPTLYTVDLNGGSASSLGTIGDGSLTITSLAINP